MAMHILALFVLLASGSIPQSAGLIPLPADGCLTPAEKSRLERETGIDGRIDIYRGASTRCLAAFMGVVAKRDLDLIERHLASWLAFLDASHKDIDANIGRKRRSRALVRYEIHLRKAIVDVKDAKLKVPAAGETAFDGWIQRAEEIRKSMVLILFPR